MKNHIAPLTAALFVAVLSPHAASALKVQTLPADTAVMSLSTHTAAEIKNARLKQDVKIITAGGDITSDSSEARKDSIRELVDLFFYDQYHHFQDPLAPCFMLMSKDANLALGIGGAVKLRGWYDFAGSIDDRGFAPYEIPVPSDPGKRRHLDGTPDETSIFLRIIGRNPLLGNITGYVQTQFSGSNHSLKLKKAYVIVSDWTVGYTITAFNDPDAEAPTIDGAGQNGVAGLSALLVRWDHDFRKPWRIGASAAIPSTQTGADDVTTKKINDWFPEMAAYVAYRLPHDAHIRLAGLARVLPYRNLLTSKNHNRLGWGVQLSSVLYPLPRLALFIEANTGQGYSAYMNDLSIGQNDLVNDPGNPGKMYAPWSMGLNFGCQYNFRPNLYAAMALAEARYFNRSGSPADDYKYGLYGSWSFIWEPTPRMQLGAEYLHGKRQNADRSHASANRIDLLFQYSF